MVVKTHTEIKTAKLFHVLLCSRVDSLMHFKGHLEKTSIEEVSESDKEVKKTGSSPKTCFVHNLGSYLPRGISEL